MPYIFFHLDVLRDYHFDFAQDTRKNIKIFLIDKSNSKIMKSSSRTKYAKNYELKTTK